MVEGVREPCVISFIRALIQFMRSTPSWPNHHQRPHFLLPLHWGLGFQHMNFRVGGHIHSIHKTDFFHLFFNRWLRIVLPVKQILWHLYILSLKKKKRKPILYLKHRLLPSQSFVIKWLQTSLCQFLHLLSNVSASMWRHYFPHLSQRIILILTPDYPPLKTCEENWVKSLTVTFI